MDRLVKVRKDTLVIYEGGKRFGSLTSHFDGIDKFLKRCDQEGVEIRSKPKKPLTVLRIYIESVRDLAVIMFFCAGLIIVIGISVHLTTKGFGLEIISAFFSFLAIGASVIVMTLIFYMPVSLKSIYLIKKQEKNP